MPHFRYRLPCSSHSLSILAFNEKFLLWPETLLGIFSPCKHFPTCTKKQPLNTACCLHSVSEVEENRVSHTLWLWSPSVSHAVVWAFCWSSGDGFWLFPCRPPAETHNYSKYFKSVPCLQNRFLPALFLTHSFGNNSIFSSPSEKELSFSFSKVTMRWDIEELRACIAEKVTGLQLQAFFSNCRFVFHSIFINYSKVHQFWS